MVSNLYDGHLPMGLGLDQGFRLQVGPLFHFLNLDDFEINYDTPL